MSIFDDLAEGILTGSPDQTQDLAVRLATELAPDRTLALHGDLGVGKTTFVQGLARGWGIQEMVTSPTYGIFTVHRSPARNLIHLDAYRLASAAQMDGLMLEDFLSSPYCLAVEWPEIIAEWLPQDTLRLQFRIVAPGQHRIALVS
jgi:tRNA threonylcarbamoyladenosine biosynthesis protein TsaE